MEKQKEKEHLYMISTLHNLKLLMICCFFGSILGKTEVFFSPDDHPTDKLLSLIQQANTKIYAAVYMITDKNIADALINAKKRGVDVKVIVDASSVDSSFGKGILLKKNNIDVFVYRSGVKKTATKMRFNPIMHHKFALIDNRLWTGSFNWTKAANFKNQENVIITDNKKTYGKFEAHFQVLKKRCDHYGVATPVEPEPAWKTYWAYIKEKSLEALQAFVYIVNQS